MESLSGGGEVKTGRRQRFHDWLMAQRDRDDAIGRLARDVAGGDGVPSGDVWCEYHMGETTAEDARIRAWLKAWAEWEGDGTARSY